MQLRWCAAIAVWTILAGPVLNNHGVFNAPSREPPRPVILKQLRPQVVTTPKARLASRTVSKY